MASKVSAVSSFVAKGHQTLHHVSASPPLIPDGRISRVRLAVSDHWLIHHIAFPNGRSLKCTPTYTPRPHGLPRDDPKAPFPPLIGHCVPRWCRPSGNHCTESPFARGQALPPLGTGFVPVSPGVTPAFSLIRAHAPDLNPLTASVLPLYESLQVAAAPAGRRPFPALSPRIFPQVPGPLPRRSPWCTCSFLPTGHRPSPSPKQVGTARKFRTTASVRRLFSRLQSFR